MSYAIVRNAKYKSKNLRGIYRHNERKNTNYSNKNIDKERTHLNYSFKSSRYGYEKEFERIRKEYNLKGQIKKVSNIACEYIITSDKEFFENIGEDETKRFFETAYAFVCEYKNLGEQYILSANVHMDEETPHMHLVYIPVVHTKDKKGNDIEKIACSEFWKERDSYRQLQNAFYDYVISRNFDLERGKAVEETKRKHIDLKEYKDMTNFEKTKETLNNMKLELPSVPELKDINISKLSKKRDEKILEEIIKPKDNMINDLYQDNITLRRELLRKSKMFEQAEKYQQERDKILADNKELHNTVENLENEYAEKRETLEKEFKEKSFDLKYEYNYKIHKLEKENKHLSKIVDTFKITVKKFIKWICYKFDVTDTKLTRDFENETRISLDVENQLAKKQKEHDHELEL